VLQGIRIRNFRIFSDDRTGILLDELLKMTPDTPLSMSAGFAPQIPMANLMALIGRNASGKSLFFDALSFASDCVTQGCSSAATQHGRQGFLKLLNLPDRPMMFDFLFFLKNGKFEKNGLGGVYVSYEFSLDQDAHGRPFYASEKVVICRKTDDGAWNTTECLDLVQGKGTVLSDRDTVSGGMSDRRASALRAYGTILSYPVLTALYQEMCHWFFCRFSMEKNGQKPAVAPGGHKHLNADGSNVQNVLDYMKIENPAAYQSVMDRISEKIPSIQRITGKLPESFRNSPDKLFLYLLLLDDPMPRPLICIETPDMGLYHDMVDILASEFRDYSVRHAFSQIIFTTHNPYILESMAPPEVWIFKRSEDDNADRVFIESAGANPVVSEMYKQGVGMGAIWYAGHFDE